MPQSNGFEAPKIPNSTMLTSQVVRTTWLGSIFNFSLQAFPPPWPMIKLCFHDEALPVRIEMSGFNPRGNPLAYCLLKQKAQPAAGRAFFASPFVSKGSSGH